VGCNGPGSSLLQQDHERWLVDPYYNRYHYEWKTEPRSSECYEREIRELKKENAELRALIEDKKS
jgi:hypothetical protein